MKNGGRSALAGDSFARSPGEDYVKRASAARLVDRLLTLSPLNREFLALKEVEEFTIEESSRVTGLKPGTVKSRLHRTREKLFHLMEREAI